MPTYLFQLGHCPALSFAEIVAANDRLGGVITDIHWVGSVVFAEAGTEEIVKTFVEELAGTIRLCKVLRTWKPGELPSHPHSEVIFQCLLEMGTDDWLITRSERPIFGFSWLGEGLPSGNRRKGHSLLQETAALLKDHLKGKECACRFVLPDPDEPSLCLNGAQVDKNNLCERGAEWVFHQHPEHGFAIGITQWLQPYEAYSKRDYGRPQRDFRSGMLPPKLARMLIALARTRETQTMLDPFCGSGSLIFEAAWLGLATTGFDLSRKAVQDSLENWRWLASQHPELKGSLRALEGDARALHTLCEPLYFDACVTEPYLGPPKKRPIKPEEWEILSKELCDLYLRALGEIRSVVKPGARVVFIAPRVKVQGREEPASLPLLGVIKLQAYKILDPMNRFQPVERRATLIYSRPQQIVQREIFVLQA